MEKPIAVTILALCAGFWVGHAQAAAQEPAAGNSAAVQPSKKTRIDPCSDLTHEKSKSREKKPANKKADTLAPATKSDSY